MRLKKITLNANNTNSYYKCDKLFDRWRLRYALPIIEINNNLKSMEKAKSNNSHCFGCGRKMGKGVPRLSIYSKHKTTWTRFLCRDCAKFMMVEQMTDLKKEITKMKRLQTKLKRMVIKSSEDILTEKLEMVAEKL